MTDSEGMSYIDIAAATANLNIQLRVLANTRTASWSTPEVVRECRQAVTAARARLESAHIHIALAKCPELLAEIEVAS